MEHFSANALGLAKVGLEKVSMGSIEWILLPASCTRHMGT